MRFQPQFSFVRERRGLGPIVKSTEEALSRDSFFSCRCTVKEMNV